MDEDSFGNDAVINVGTDVALAESFGDVGATSVDDGDVATPLVETVVESEGVSKPVVAVVSSFGRLVGTLFPPLFPAIFPCAAANEMRNGERRAREINQD